MPSMRDTSRSAWNGSRSCSRSPMPTNAIGTPTTPTTDSAAPPRASPSIFVSTTPVTPIAVMELAGALDRVLPGHRVGDVQQVRRLDRRLDRLELRHQLVVDVQPARRVDDERVEPEVLRRRQRARRARDRIHLARRIVHARADLPGQHRQLLDRRRPPHVGRDQHRMPALLRQPPRQLRRRRRLARALQARASGRRAARAASRDSPPGASPNSASISSRTIRTTCCAGVRLCSTSSPTALTRTRSTNALTTRKLTSASSSARRISRSAASTVALGQPRFAAERLEDVLQAGAERFEHGERVTQARTGTGTFQEPLTGSSANSYDNRPVTLAATSASLSAGARPASAQCPALQS